MGQLAYISCDPWVYPGHQNAQTTISDAIQNIQGPNGTQGAIVLYSRTSTFCTYAANNIDYPWVYTMTNTTESKDLGDSLNSTGLPSVITLDTTSSVNTTTPATNNPADTLGPSPTTAVAMIILYSITGIITTLFLVIIITGAVRAHRHPERYGPRNVIGRPRQTRARGIARAMLESLPIVKFGETGIEATKAVPNERDIEFGTTERPDPRTATSSEAERSPTAPKKQHAEAGNTDGDIVTTQAAEGIAPHTDRTEGGVGNDAESGLACSVCTEDFVKGQDIRILPCNHKFHPDCIDPWLLNVSGTCPMW